MIGKSNSGDLLSKTILRIGQQILRTELSLRVNFPRFWSEPHQPNQDEFLNYKPAPDTESQLQIILRVYPGTTTESRNRLKIARSPTVAHLYLVFAQCALSGAST